MKFLCLLFLLICNLCDARINFVHIPKCGGSTIRHLLRDNFHKSQIYPYRKVGKCRIGATEKQQMEDVFNEFPEINHEVAFGHFPMWFFQEKDPDYDTSFFFTVLRDPIERILSRDRNRMKNQKRKGKEVYSDPLSMGTNNMANYLCKVLCSDCTLEGDELLEDCIRNLERMDFIIFMDNYDYEVKYLFDKLGLECPEKTPHHRISSSKEFVQDINDELIAKLEEANSLDVQLYNYAKKKYHKDVRRVNAG